ncbi:hypothetical protein CDD83_6144 [Cordyceps sp. RAO-2017]|nr:hypothetical protein CDD83_6144 [Cordyceps sp. RAO-2017]
MDKVRLLSSPSGETESTGDSDQRQPTTPPPYSGPSLNAEEVSPALVQQIDASVKFPVRYLGLPRLDYRLYSPPLFKLSADTTTISTKAEYLSTNATALAAFIRAQATVPPKPQIQVRGTRGRRLDFDIKLNLMTLLVPEDDRQRIDYLRCVGDSELAYRGGARPDVLPAVGDGGLDEWCRRFTQDTAPVKSFALDRIVANLDTSWIEGQLRSLIASAKYRGSVEVTFLVAHSRVLVHSPDRFNQFLTSVTSLFSSRNKYEVVKAVWPFATTKNGEQGRKCVVNSENVWWLEWRDTIRYVISQRRQGWVTCEDKLESVMEGKCNQAEDINWGPEIL